jgi:hypothetical protein
MMPPVFQS